MCDGEGEEDDGIIELFSMRRLFDDAQLLFVFAYEEYNREKLFCL